MKNVYVHIGLEKTGTTALQIFLCQNHAALEKNGLVYLVDKKKPYVHGIGHFPIVASFFDKCPNFVPIDKHRPSSDVLEALARDVQESEQDIILSCEHFSSRLSDPENIAALKSALMDRQVTIICYLRRQDEQAISLYSTLVKGGATEPLSIDEVTPENRYFNYRRILADWADVFGKQNIVIREYDRRNLVEGDICKDFVALLDVSLEEFEFLDDQNISLDSLQVELLRNINRHLTSFPWGAWDVDMEKFQQSQDVRTAIVPFLPKGVHISALIDSGERREILDRFQEENLRIVENFDDAKFILNWYNGDLIVSPSPAPSKPGRDDLEKAVVACGLELTKKSQYIHDLELNNRNLLEEREAALKSNAELHTELEASKFRFKKFCKGHAKRLRNIFIRQ